MSDRASRDAETVRKDAIRAAVSEVLEIERAKHTLLVTNIDFRSVESDVTAAFAPHCAVVGVCLHRNNKSAKTHLGRGIIEFPNAIELGKGKSAAQREEVLVGVGKHRRAVRIADDARVKGRLFHRRSHEVIVPFTGLQMGVWSGRFADPFIPIWCPTMATSPEPEFTLQPISRSATVLFLVETRGDTDEEIALRSDNSEDIYWRSLLRPLGALTRLDFRLSAFIGHVHLSGAVLTFHFSRPPYAAEVETGGFESILVQNDKDPPFQRIPDPSHVGAASLCNALQISFGEAIEGNDDLKKLMRALSRLHLRPSESSRQLLVDSAGHKRAGASSSVSASTAPCSSQWLTDVHVRSLPFDSLYALEILRTRVHGAGVDAALELANAAVRIAATGAANTEQLGASIAAVVNTLTRNSTAATPTLPTSPDAAVSMLLVAERRDASAGFHAAAAGSQQEVIIRRVFITPSRLIARPAQSEDAVRAIRIAADAHGLTLRAVSEHFLRVAFVDENMAPTFYRGRGDDTMEPLYDRIAKVLAAGFDVGGRHFSYFCYSMAMLKEHACWFYSPPSGLPPSVRALSADELRARLGDFAAIPVVAKCAARMSQCFSSAVLALRLDASVEHTRAEDITTADERYTFSDGVGTVSLDLARRVYAGYRRSHGQPPRRLDDVLSPTGLPSAFQIRFGGAKGVVSVDSRIPASAGPALRIRPSMQKFPCADTGLEVCSVARAGPAFLNRQIITVLQAQGVPDAAFEGLQDRLLHLVASSAEPGSVRGAIAASGGLLCGGLDLAAVDALVAAGVSIADEPFLRTLLHSARASLLQDLVRRGRVLVPQGAQLVGVMDESGVLEDGEVYFRCGAFVGAATAASAGGGAPPPPPAPTEVLVTRSPCLHPGDARTLVAQPAAALAARAAARGDDGASVLAYFDALREVLVFPSKGARPHPSECAGGDLDGDVYTVLWDHALVPPAAGRNPPAADYSAPPPLVAPTLPVSVDQITHFFVDYIRNDKLGVIATYHLALSDASEEPRGGAWDPACLELARLHSVAVDFAKTGIPAVLPRRAQVLKYPDFMGNTLKDSYPSTKALGRMYRQALAAAAASWPVSAATVPVPVAADPELMLPGHERFAAAACRARDDWGHELEGLMWRVGSWGEGEVLSGRPARFGSREYRKRRVHDARDMLAREVRSLRAAFRRRFFADAAAAANDDDSRSAYCSAISMRGDGSGDGSVADGDGDGVEFGALLVGAALEAALQLASAWYAACYCRGAGRAPCTAVSASAAAAADAAAAGGGGGGTPTAAAGGGSTDSAVDGARGRSADSAGLSFLSLPWMVPEYLTAVKLRMRSDGAFTAPTPTTRAT